LKSFDLFEVSKNKLMKQSNQKIDNYN